jgi:ribosomal protein S11
MFWLRYNFVYYYFVKVFGISRFVKFIKKDITNKSLNLFLVERFSNLFEFRSSFFLCVLVLIKNLIFYFKKNYSNKIDFSKSWRIVYINYLKTHGRGDDFNDFRLIFPLRLGKKLSYLKLNRSSLMKKSLFLLKKRYTFFRSGFLYQEKRRQLRNSYRYACTIKYVKNNIFFTFFSCITGVTIINLSAGRLKFRGKKKKTPFAANKVAFVFAKRVALYLKKLKTKRRISVQLRLTNWGLSSGVMKQAFHGLKEGGLLVTTAIDAYKPAHALPVRKKKARRV